MPKKLIQMLTNLTPPLKLNPGEGEKFERSAIQGPIIGGPFTLVDTECRVVNERSLIGNWVLLYFGYTSSPDIGPAEVQKMAEAIDILGSIPSLLLLFYPYFITLCLCVFSYRVKKNRKRILKFFQFLSRLILIATAPHTCMLI